MNRKWSMDEYGNVYIDGKRTKGQFILACLPWAIIGTLIGVSCGILWPV